MLKYYVLKVFQNRIKRFSQIILNFYTLSQSLQHKKKPHLYKYDISFLSINSFIIVYTYTGCKKCPPGTNKEIVGCGPCRTIPVTPDTNISTTTATTEKSTTATTEKSSTTSGLFINHNYLAISARKAESIGLFICFWCTFLKTLQF